jgi:hypothetical protein
MFFVLMVDAPRSPAPPPRVHAIDVFFVDHGHSLISLMFFALMVGAPGSPSPPPRGARCQHLFS